MYELSGQFIAEADALAAEIVAAAHPRVEHAVEVVLRVADVFGRTLAAHHQSRELPGGVFHCPAVENVAIRVQAAVVARRRVGRLHAHLHAEVEEAVDAQRPVAILKMVDEAARHLRIGRSHVGVLLALLLGREHTATVIVEFKELRGRNLLAVGGDEERIALAVKPGGFVGENCAHGVALSAGIGRILGHRLAQNLVFVEAEVQVGGPFEVFRVDVARCNGQFKAVVLHRCPVDGGRGEARFQGQHPHSDEVGGMAEIIVETERDGVVEEGHIDARIHVLRLFPAQFRVGRGFGGNHRLGVARNDNHAVERANEIGRGILVDVALKTVGRTHGEVAHGLGFLHERLLADAPERTHGVERQIAVFLRHAKHVATVETDASAEGVAVAKRVGGRRKPRHEGVFGVRLLVQRILLGHRLRGENHGLRGERAVVVAIGHRIERTGLGVAHLGAEHHLYFVDFIPVFRIFGHRLPRPLVVVVFGHLVGSAVGQNRAFSVGEGVGGKELFLAHRKGVLASVFREVIVVELQAELRGEFQAWERFQLGIENGHQLLVAAFVVAVGALLEDVEVERRIFLALHVGVVNVVALGVVGRHVGIGQSRIIDGIRKSVVISEIATLTAPICKHRRAELQHPIDLVIDLQREVEAVVFHARHVALLVVVAERGIVVGAVAAAREAHVVFLVENAAEEDVVPVGVDVAKSVDGRLCLGRECAPTALFIGVGEACVAQNLCHAALVFAEGVVRGQKCQFEVGFLRRIEQIQP